MSNWQAFITRESMYTSSNSGISIIAILIQSIFKSFIPNSALYSVITETQKDLL